MITAVPREYLRAVWPQVAEGFEKAVDEVSAGRWTAIDLLQDLMDGKQTLFVHVVDNEIQGAASAKISQYLHRKIVSIEAVAGRDLETWVEDMDSAIREWGRAQGCDGAEATGRAGWDVIARRLGYRKVYVTYEREI